MTLVQLFYGRHYVNKYIAAEFFINLLFNFNKEENTS